MDIVVDLTVKSKSKVENKSISVLVVQVVRCFISIHHCNYHHATDVHYVRIVTGFGFWVKSTVPLGTLLGTLVKYPSSS